MATDPTNTSESAAIVAVRQVDTPGEHAPPNATWSKCLVIGQEIVMSGVTARGADGVPVGGNDMKAQTLACLQRIAAHCEAAGGHRGNIYKIVVYITDITRKDEVNAARAEFLAPIYPCSTLVEVKGLAFPDLIVEIDAFANLDIDLGRGPAPA